MLLTLIKLRKLESNLSKERKLLRMTNGIEPTSLKFASRQILYFLSRTDKYAIL